MMEVVQACLSAWKDLQSNFPYSGGAVKRVLTSFSVEMGRRSSFARGGKLWSSYWLL